MYGRALDGPAVVDAVRRALDRLHNRALLQTTPLRSMLARGGVAPTAEALQQALLEAIASLRPGDDLRQTSPEWRGYRYLWLRYVQGAGLHEVADALGVAERQARRHHREALEAVASILWTRYRGTAWPPEGKAPDAASTGTSAPDPDEEGTDLAVELARLTAGVPHGPTSLAETLVGVLETAARLIEQHGARADPVPRRPLPPIAMHQLVLRQILMSALAHLVRHGDAGGLGFEVAPGPDAVSLTMTYAWSAREWSTRGRPPPAGEAPLELASRLAASHGGLVVASEGVGRSRVVLRLPVTAVTTVVVVDDNLDFIALCQRLLEEHGYRVVGVNLPTDALQVARELLPDAIVLDVLMPSHDGWEVLRTLAGDELTHRIPVVVCSVLREPALALELGAADFVPKRLTSASLLPTLERVRATREAPRGSPG
jgi:CheY-like chemotaxis protein